MIRRCGLASILCLIFATPTFGGELPGKLFGEVLQPNSDPLGLHLANLCEEIAARPTAQHLQIQLQTELQRLYSPRHLERLLALGNTEVRRAAARGIGVIGNLQSLPLVVTALNDPDDEVRRLATLSCRQIWVRLGTPEQQARLLRIQESAQNQELQSAAAQASLLIQSAPNYAEAWNERAMVYFQMNRYAESIADCRQTLELNPYHFGAASGMSQCHLRLKQIPEAIEALKLTAKIHPRLPGLAEQIADLQSAETSK